MKKILFITVILFLISCSNKNSFLNRELITEDFTVKNYSREALIKEKLLEFHNLNILLKKHTNFKKEINNRIKEFLLDTTNIIVIDGDSKIQNIKHSKLFFKINDSVYKTKIYYNLVNKSELKKDSLFVVFYKKKKIIGNEELWSTKIKFSKF